MMTWVKRAVWLVLAVAIVVGLAQAWRPKPLEVESAAVTTGRIEATVDEQGRTRVRDRYTISTPFTGNLRRLELHPGDAVEADTVIARIVPVAPSLLDARTRAEAETRVRMSEASLRQSEAAVRRAQGELEFSRTEAERQRRLAASGAIPARDLELAEFQVRSRTDELASAQFRSRVSAFELENSRVVLRRTSPDPSRAPGDEIEIRSPTRGRVLRLLREDGGVVNAGTALVEIGDTAALEVVVDVLTTDAVQVRSGAHVTLERWGGEQPLTGHVRLVEPSAFTRVSALGVEEQRVNTLIDIHESPDVWRSLGDGYRVEARIVVWEGESVTRVPLGALFRDNGAWAVYVIEGAVARKRAVEVGHRGGTDMQVVRGLRAGERVIVHPSDKLVDGAAVRGR
jgi:HlyD family secretion protein